MLDDGSKSWLADVNNDGRADLVTQAEPGGVNAGRVAVGLSNGLSFPQWSWVSPERRLDDVSNTWVVDLSGDGKADLITQSVAGNFYTGLSDGLTFGFWSWAF
jgi:hypothetical protein